MKKILFSIFFFSCLFIAAQLPGTFDPLFGINGKVLLNNPKPYSGFSGICVQADNKILLCGTIDSMGFSRLYVTRLNSNGMVDINFASAGKFIDKILYTSSAADIIVQPDGKILITGSVSSPNPSSKENLFVMRLLSNGTKDNTFGNNGIFIANIATPTSKFNGGGKIKIANNGSIFIGGYVTTGIGTNPGMAVFKITPNGQLDTQFGIGGYRNFNFSFWDHLNDIAIQSEGKILFTGGTFNPNYTITMRLKVNGAVDSSFAVNGKFIKAFLTNDQQAKSILVTKNKKILVSGYEESIGNGNIFIYRLDSLGNIDLTYGNNGYINYDSGVYDSPTSMVELSDKSILICGSVTPGIGWGDIEIVAFDSLGVLNTAFGNNGNFTFDINNSNEFSYCSVMQPDGKILNAGFSDSSYFVTRLFTTDYTGLKKYSQKKNNVKVFPNPASDHINIVSSDKIIDYELVDISGVSVKSLSSFKSLVITVSNLPVGLYFLKIFSETNNFEIFKISISR